MIQRQDFDEAVPFPQQLRDTTTGPITLINTFTCAEGEVDALISAWKLDSDIMKASPGFISAQLYVGQAGARVVTNIAVWESVEDLRAAHGSAGFQEILQRYPDGTISRPTVMRKVAVAGICVA